MTTLQQCFNRNRSDRGSRRHAYDRVYGAMLQPERMLEIGVLRGEGLAAWLEYFPDTRFVVVDTFELYKPPEILKHPRVTWHRADSRDVQLDGTFDVIIDDGAHDPRTHAQTFKNLFRYCTGTYYIEDVWPLDDLTTSQRGLFRQWCDSGWINPAHYTTDRYNELISTLSRHNPKRHDLRGNHSPDSFIFEIAANQ